MVFPSARKPGSASPLCSFPAGVQFGPPSLTWVLAVPSGRTLSTRVLKQPSVPTCATTKKIQSSLDQAGSPNVGSDGGPAGATISCGSEPSALITHKCALPDEVW